MALPGGAALNVASNLQRLGGRPMLFSGIGHVLTYAGGIRRIDLAEYQQDGLAFGLAHGRFFLMFISVQAALDDESSQGRISPPVNSYSGQSLTLLFQQSSRALR